MIAAGPMIRRRGSDSAAVREFVLEVPAHAQHDDLAIEVAALEELFDSPQLAHKASVHEGHTELLLAALVCNRTR
jgi:hypothetical protein